MKRLSPLLIVALVIACGRTEDDLSDSQAAEVIENTFNNGSIKLSLGHIQVVGQPPYTDRRLSVARLRVHRAFATVGVLQIQDVPAAFTGWDDLRRYGEGIDEEIVIEAIPRGLQLSQHRPTPEEPFLEIPTGEYKVDEILQNELLAKPPDRYRVVRGHHRAVRSPEHLAALAELRLFPALEEKFYVLLMYDPFKKTWIVVTHDVAGRQQAFKTNNVREYLDAL